MLEIVEKGTDRENIFKVFHLDIKRGGTKEEWMDLRLRGREGRFGGVKLPFVGDRSLPFHSLFYFPSGTRILSSSLYFNQNGSSI